MYLGGKPCFLSFLPKARPLLKSVEIVQRIGPQKLFVYPSQYPFKNSFEGVLGLEIIGSSIFGAGGTDAIAGGKGGAGNDSTRSGLHPKINKNNKKRLHKD